MSSDEKQSRDARGEASPETEGSEHNTASGSSGAAADGNGTRDETTESAPGAAELSGAEPGGAEPGGVESASGGGEVRASDSPAASGGEPESVPEPKAAANIEPRKSSGAATYYNDYDYQKDDPYASKGKSSQTSLAEPKPEPKKTLPPPPPPPGGGDSSGGGDEDGMVRMSFLEHLEELRKRILHSIYGLTIVYLACLAFANTLYDVIKQPFLQGVKDLPYNPPLELIAITLTEQFYLIWVKVPLVAGIFLGSPWLMYQVWSFIAPGLYKRERRWALPFIFSTAALFIIGGVFGYFVVLRFAINFLVGVGAEEGIHPMISVDSYFNTVIALLLGLGVVFQMPIVIFFLTLIRLVTPRFLIKNARYAILLIFVLAAAITPTPDVFNMILFAGPMVLLFYVGILASYLLVLSREGRRMPPRVWLTILAVVLLIGAGVVYYLQTVKGFHFVPHFPWFVGP